MDNNTQQGPPPQVDDLLQIDANSLTADSVRGCEGTTSLRT
jgi:hypothetical protein